MGLADFGAYPGNDDPRNFGSHSIAVDGTAQVLLLPTGAMRVVITSVGGGGLHFSFAAAAATTNYFIAPGATFVYQGRPVNVLHFLGIAPFTGTVSIHAS